MTWICSQIGAREHYAIPRVLHREGKLARLYTDRWANAPLRSIGRITGMPVFEARYHRDLRKAHVSAFNLSSMIEARRSRENPYEGFLRSGTSFARRVTKAMERRNPVLDQSFVFFGYDTGFLECGRWVRERGGRSIVCQMDPSRVEFDLVRAEEKRWPGWAKRPMDVPEAYVSRREVEWDVADRVMVNSEWTRQALVRQGVDGAKIVVVPLAFERESSLGGGQGALGGESVFKFPVSGFSRTHPLRVLFLGQVILRKGIPYLVEAARMLKHEPVRFDVVGPIGVSADALASVPENMTFHGPVSRSHAGEMYSRSDIFVLPTVSDGFALTQLEAMAHGLPVISTPNCGEVVTDQRDGLIVAACDSMALAESIQLLLQDPGRLLEMAVAARQKVSLFGLDRLAEHLAGLEQLLE